MDLDLHFRHQAYAIAIREQKTPDPASGAIARRRLKSRSHPPQESTGRFAMNNRLPVQPTRNNGEWTSADLERDDTKVRACIAQFFAAGKRAVSLQPLNDCLRAFDRLS